MDLLGLAPMSSYTSSFGSRLHANAQAARFTQRLLLVVVLGSAAAIGCGSPEASMSREAGSAEREPSSALDTSPAPDKAELGTLAQPILGGTVDDAHPEVMLLADAAGFLCTGTNILSEDGTGFLLTAAHCVTEVRSRGVVALPPERFLVVPGTDFSESTLAFAVDEISVEPGYDGSFAVDDIAVVRFVFGGAPEPPAIEPLLADDDDLALADELLLIGYGQTENPGLNTERRRVERSIAALDDEVIVHSQEDGDGACFGDSGGPGLVEVGGEERVAVVISGGVSDSQDDCADGIGISTRVSAYEDFIEGVLEGN